jgi:hypothetical protein
MLKIYAVMDTKAEAFMNPFYVRTLGEAIRSFTDESNKQESPFFKHPEDFNLFELGDFDQFTGVLQPHKAPKSIGTSASFKTQSQQLKAL